MAITFDAKKSKIVDFSSKKLVEKYHVVNFGKEVNELMSISIYANKTTHYAQIHLKGLIIDGVAHYSYASASVKGNGFNKNKASIDAALLEVGFSGFSYCESSSIEKTLTELCNFYGYKNISIFH